MMGLSRIEFWRAQMSVTLHDLKPITIKEGPSYQAF